MQQLDSDDVVTPTFLMEVFNRFFSKTFEKDPKYSLFQKEWESFKEILGKDPLDLDQVFTYIAKVQLNLEQSTKAVNPFTNENAFPQANGAISQGGLTQGQNNYSNYSPALGAEAGTSVAQKNDALYTSPRISGRNSDATSQNVTPVVPKQLNFNANTSGTMSAPTTKYQLGYLVEKSKAMKQNLQKHNDGLAEIYTSAKRVQDYQKENRSALKKIVIYAKQANMKELTRNIESKLSNPKNSTQNQTILYY